MKKTIYLLVTVTIVAPFFSVAHGESMEERRQRIMRKYLGERQEIVQSGITIDTGLEDERVLESEKLKDPQVSFERQEGVAMRPAPPPSSVRIAQDMERNWLLGVSDEEEDVSADPYYTDSQYQTGYEDSWSQWGAEANDSNYDKSRTASRYDEERRGESSRSDRAGYYDSQRQGGTDTDEGVIVYTPEGFRMYSSSALPEGNYSTGVDGQRIYSGSVDGGSSVSGARVYGAPAPTGLLKTPYTAPGSSSSDPSKSPSLTPYKNPYQSMQGMGGQQPGRSQQQPEFKRTTPYQQWKGSSQSYDPTKDDAYLDELMRRNRQ